jgi:hypothetical protein
MEYEWKAELTDAQVLLYAIVLYAAVGAIGQIN